MTPERPATFLFADIAGFTALTEAHGDDHAADLVANFCEAVRCVLPEYDARAVKSIGDAVLIRVPEPAAAIRLGTRIAHELMSAHGSPAVRVGMHHGPAVERDGDYFGSTVNLAARVSGVAAGGEVLLTASTGRSPGRLTTSCTKPVAATAAPNVREFDKARSPCWPDPRSATATSSIPSARWSSTRPSRRPPQPRGRRLLLLHARVRG